MNERQSAFLKCISYSGPLAPISHEDADLVAAFSEANQRMPSALESMELADFTPEFLETLGEKYESLPHPGRVVVFCATMSTTAKPGGSKYVPVFKEFYKATVCPLLDVFGQRFGVKGVDGTVPPYCVNTKESDSDDEERVSIHTEAEFEELRQIAAAYYAKKEASVKS